MNGFEKFGIKRLSPFGVNCWIANPALWTVIYLLKPGKEDAARAARGRAIEAGGTAFLHGHSSVEAMNKAMGLWGQEAKSGEDWTTEAAKIGPMLEQALRLLSPLKDSKPLAQVRCEAWIEGCPIPVIGYADWVWPDWLTDLKTTDQIPSGIKPEHCITLSIYAKARNATATCLYTSSKRAALYSLSDEDQEAAWKKVEKAAKSLGKFLEKSDSPQEAVQLLPMNEDDYRWTETTKQAYRNVTQGQAA